MRVSEFVQVMRAPYLLRQLIQLVAERLVLGIVFGLWRVWPYGQVMGRMVIVWRARCVVQFVMVCCVI